MLIRNHVHETIFVTRTTSYYIFSAGVRLHDGRLDTLLHRRVSRAIPAATIHQLWEPFNAHNTPIRLCVQQTQSGKAELWLHRENWMYVLLKKRPRKGYDRFTSTNHIVSICPDYFPQIFGYRTEPNTIVPISIDIEYVL